MNNKKAVSEVIGYVLLISISLTLASLVFIWLKNYLPSDVSSFECEENVALIIKEFNYTCGSSPFLNLTIQNRGFFNVDGYILRVNNQSNAEVGIYSLNRTGNSLRVGEVYLDNYSLFIIDNGSPILSYITGNLTLVEIQPILIKNGKKVYCNNFVSKQVLSCN